MKIAFPFAIFIFSLVFTFIAFQLDIMEDFGRPGSGFFPVIIGICLIFFSAIGLYKAWKDTEPEAEDEGFPKEMVWVVLISAVLILVMRSIGALISMVLFSFVILYLFNRKRKWQNIIVSLSIPTVIYILFELWLNAGLPKGILDPFM